MRIGILGGGITGLALGCFIGKNAEILEKEKETGGLCRSLHEKGFTFDYGGSHIIFSKDKEALGFMLNVLGRNRNSRRRNARILFKGRQVKYPFENGLGELPVQDNFECLYGYIENLLKREKGKVPAPRNFKEWVYYTFGKGIAEKYLIPYNEKIWNAKATELGIEWIENRVPQPPVEDIIKSSLGIATEGYTHQLHFHYPKKGGIEALLSAMEKRVSGRVTKNFCVKSIRKDGNEWVVSNGKEERRFDGLISTIPLFDLVPALKGVPKEVTKAVRGLRYTSLITVMIGVRGTKLNDVSWLYLPENSTMANRVSFPSNYSAFVAPKGTSSVLAEITCSEKDNLWKRKDSEIAGEIIGDLHKLGLIDKRKVCYSRVMRTKYAYVVYDLEYEKKMRVIRRYFSKMGIELCGRFSEFKYMNMDACIRSARKTARRFGCGRQ